MASRTRRPCAAPTCGRLVVNGYCPAHAHRAYQPEAERRLYDDRRGSSTARGYDAEWKRFRAEFLAEPENHVCHDCRDAPARCVHHKQKIRTHPELRLVRSNCRPLCKRCHDRRTARGE